MLDFIKYIPTTSGRAIPAYQQFLRAQMRYVDRRYKRFQQAIGFESNAIRLLRFILNYLDLEYMDRQVNNFDRYLYHVRLVQEDIARIFSRVKHGAGYTNIFFKKESTGSTEEFILPIEDVNTLRLPIHSEKWEDWVNIKPVILWYHNSPEYTINIMNDQFHFTEEAPKQAIVLIDTVALLMKYYVWFHEERKNEISLDAAMQTPQQLFLHKYVMCNLVWDSTDIALFQWFNKIYDTDDVSDFDSNNLKSSDSQYGWVALNSRIAYESIYKLINEGKGNLHPSVLFNTNFFTYGSLATRGEMINSRYVVPTNANYEYLRWLRDRDLLHAFVRLWSTRAKLPESKTIQVNLKRDYARMIKRRPWNICTNSDTRDMIELDMIGFEQYLSW